MTERRSSSRRDFLRRSAFAAAALATHRLHAQAATPQRKLGIALLGLGSYSRGQLGPALRETKNCYLAGVVTGTPEKAEHWAAEFNLKKQNVYSYQNFDKIADNPDIDIVYVVTPPALHPEFVIRAAKAGKHVISEKPMATSIADCDRMIAACKDAKVQLGIGYRLHFDTFHKELMRHAREQDFGSFMKMSGAFSFVFGRRAWRIDKGMAGGGPMMDLGIYVLHAALMAKNGEAPVAVTAHEEPKMKPELFDEVEETLRWTMEFADGARCDGVTSFNQSADNFRAEGAKGWVDFKQTAFMYRGIVCETSAGPLRFPIINQQAAQMDDFADCVLTGRKTPVPGELGKRDIQIITAIYEAARSGTRVPISLPAMKL